MIWSHSKAQLPLLWALLDVCGLLSAVLPSNLIRKKEGIKREEERSSGGTSERWKNGRTNGG